jgi:hypothetical protein
MSDLTIDLQANLLDDGIVDTLVAVGASTTESVCSLVKGSGCGTCRLFPILEAGGNLDLLSSCQRYLGIQWLGNGRGLQKLGLSYAWPSCALLMRHEETCSGACLGKTDGESM